MEKSEIAAREGGLNKALTRSQVVMIGLGGAIGTGLFMGSGVAIGYAGPAVVLSFVIAALAAVAIVFSLSEMAVVHPTAGSFGTYAEIYLNPWAGFIVRYSYWMAQVIAVGAEAVAAGLYMTFWFPDTQVWMWSLGFAFALLYFNSRSVQNFGSIEYWFAMIKVVAIILFIILGASMILGLGRPPTGFNNLTGLPGGFTPNGFHGVWMAVLVGVLSFNGIEVIAVTSGETRDPVRDIPAALRNMGLRLFLFYILALGIVVTIVPWTETGAQVVTQSPFVRVFANSGIRHAAGIMNFVVLTAALSSMNTNVYLCSRMLFSLSRGNFAPRFLGRPEQERDACRGHPGFRGLHSAGGRSVEAHAACLQLPVRSGALRCHDRLGCHPAEPFQLPPPLPEKGLAGVHAAVSLRAARRTRCVDCRADYDGARQGGVGYLLDRGGAVARVVIDFLFCAASESGTECGGCTRLDYGTPP